MKNIINNKIFGYGMVLVTGILLGWLIFKSAPETHVDHDHDHDHETTDETTYTCSMHPQIRQNEPGDCPLCGMDLIPVVGGSGSDNVNPLELEMSVEAMALANVVTRKVEMASPEKEISLTGKISLNEQNLATITANFPGRIDKLYIDFTGQEVRKGQKLATVYSPELVTAQQELIEAAKFREVNQGLYMAAREKLRLWKITDIQIDEIENSGAVLTGFDVYADRSGVVLRRAVALGDFIGKGSVLFEIADLSHVWVMLDAYESDLTLLRNGQKVDFTVSALPGKIFTSSIAFIDPFINPATRTASVRAEINNPQKLLKPEMFVQGTIRANFPVSAKSLVIPATSLLWTGKRSVVYVKVAEAESPTFEMREIVLGPALGDYYMVESGLTEGEEIVANGAFSIDAAAQLAGKPSMMNPGGGTMNSGHQHGTSSGNTHEEGHSVKEQRVVSKPEKLSLTNEGKSALQSLFTSYMGWKDALANDQFEVAVKQAGVMKVNANKITANLFAERDREAWTKYLSALRSSLEHVAHWSDIEQSRKSFQATSAILVEMSEYVQPLEKPLYVQHCPMADNNKGADWLSLEREIRNPYFGSSMLTCGEVTKEFK